jgi:hypothetical protein
MSFSSEHLMPKEKIKWLPALFSTSNTNSFMILQKHTCQQQSEDLQESITASLIRQAASTVTDNFSLLQ